LGFLGSAGLDAGVGVLRHQREGLEPEAEPAPAAFPGIGLVDGAGALAVAADGLFGAQGIDDQSTAVKVGVSHDVSNLSHSIYVIRHK
jgi:hypothetical protein